MREEHGKPGEGSPPRSLIVLVSYHHKNTEKVARVIAEVIDAPIVAPQDVRVDELHRYDLIGFGSGIFDGKNHGALLDIAERLPPASGKRTFIFSTNGAPAAAYGSGRYDLQADYLKLIAKNHLPLRKRLESKGYRVIGEFSCAGHNTNGVLRLIGGTNKGRPSVEDLQHAGQFARELVGRT